MQTFHLLSSVMVLLCLGDACQAQLFRRLPARSPEPQAQASPSSLETQYDEHPLIKLIRSEQNKHVGVSTGTEAAQCFTTDDLRNFKREDVPGQVTARLKKASEFAALVGQIRLMAPADRSRLLSRASKTFKPTWQQLGKITSAGQTDAGQEAERLLAKAITQLAVELLDTP
jgi:hypothetical protein